MSIFHKILKVCLLALIAMGISACNSETHNNNKITNKTSFIPNNKYPGKPELPVDMKYKFTSSKKIAVGENIVIELTFKTKKIVDDLVIQLRSDSELVLMNSSNEYSFGPQAKGSKSVLDLTVQPSVNGYYYIYISASLDEGGIRQSRSFTIPLNVGNVDARKYMKPAGVIHEDSTGQKIISMPASQPKM